jgi:hypothetical protein
VIGDVGIKIEALRVARIGISQPGWVWGYEPSHRGAVVPCAEVVEVAFGVSFFSGEVEWVVSDGAEVVSEGKTGVGADELRDGGGAGVADSPADVVFGADLVLLAQLKTLLYQEPMNAPST